MGRRRTATNPAKKKCGSASGRSRFGGKILNTIETMNDPYIRQTGDWNKPDGNGVSEVKQATREAVEEGEECVRTHPFSSIVVAFGGGLILGMLVGWSIAEQRHEDMSDRCRRVLRDWQRRLHMS